MYLSMFIHMYGIEVYMYVLIYVFMNLSMYVYVCMYVCYMHVIYVCMTGISEGICELEDFPASSMRPAVCSAQFGCTPT